MIGLRGLEVDPRARTCSTPAALAQHKLARAAPPGIPLGSSCAWDDNPASRATFGIFKGSDMLIYSREIY